MGEGYGRVEDLKETNRLKKTKKDEEKKKNEKKMWTN